MPEMLLPENTDAVVEEVASKISRFDSSMSNLLEEREMFWDMYRGVPKLAHNREKTEGNANIAASTMQEAVETLTGTIYAMLTAADPNFSVTGLSGDSPPDALRKVSHLLRYQRQRVGYKSKLLPAIRSAVINGSVFIDQPWISWPSGTLPVWEATGFKVKPMHQVFWQPSAVDIKESDYIGTVDAVTRSQIRRMAAGDPKESVWIKAGVDESLADGESNDMMPEEVKRKLESLGYTDFKDSRELAIYWGPLESEGINTDMVVGLVNRKHLVRYHPSPYPWGLRPIMHCPYISTENEPAGLGVGHQMKEIQKWINSNLNRSMDVVTFSLLNMFIASRYAGLKYQNLKVRPWNVIEVDDINGIKNLVPDVNSASYGLKIYELLVEMARNSTGATPTLQAVITEASASEVRIAQNNSIRRVSNTAEIMAETLIREHLIFSHYSNVKFLDRPIWMRVAGVEEPLRIFPGDINHQIDIDVKIVTDKDFTPQTIKNYLQLLQILTSVRNQIPANVNLLPIIEDLVVKLGSDPSKIFTPTAPTPPNPQALLGLLQKDAAMRQGPAGPVESANVAMGGVNGIQGLEGGI